MRCVGGLLVYAMIFFCVFTGLYPNPFTAYRSLIKDCAQVQPKNLTVNVTKHSKADAHNALLERRSLVLTTDHDL